MGFVWNWTSKVKGMKQYWTQLDKTGGESCKLYIFHERHTCIVPKCESDFRDDSNETHVFQV